MGYVFLASNPFGNAIGTANHRRFVVICCTILNRNVVGNNTLLQQTPPPQTPAHPSRNSYMG